MGIGNSLFFAAAGFALSVWGGVGDGMWRLPPTIGKAAGDSVVWADGANWTHAAGNPLVSDGAVWRLAAQTNKNPALDAPFVPMTPGGSGGKAVWLCEGTASVYRDGLSARVVDRTPQRSPSAVVLFRPPRAGWYRVALQATLKSQIPAAGYANAEVYVLTNGAPSGMAGVFKTDVGSKNPPLAIRWERTLLLARDAELAVRVQSVNPGPASAGGAWLSVSDLCVSAVSPPAQPEPLMPIEKALASQKGASRSVTYQSVALIPAPPGVSVALRERDGAVLADQAADFMLDSFEEALPKGRLVTVRGKPNVSAEVRDGIAAHGGRSLSVRMGVPETNGYHEAGLVWSFKPPADLSGYDGLTLRYRAHDDDFHSFFVIVSEPGGVLYRLTLEPRPGLAGQWQTLTVPNRYGWYLEGARDPDGKLDLSRITSLRFRLFDTIKKPFSFDLDALGFVKRREVYTGPSVAFDGPPVLTNGAPFSVTVRCAGHTSGEPLDIVLATVDFFGRTNVLGTATLSPAVTHARIAVTLPNPGAGFWTLKALLRAQGKDLFQASRAFAALRPMDPRDREPNADSIFGVWVGGTPQQIGAKWTRDYVWGNRVTQTNGLFRYGDQPPGTLNLSPPPGVFSILHFTYVPKCLSSRPEANDFGKYPPADWEAYGRYLEWVMQGTRAGGYRLYEMWNEPNPYAYWNGTVDDVVKLAEVTYKAVKKVDPDARVLGPCPFGFTFDFLDAFFSKGGNRWIDDVVLHTYTPGPPDDDFLPGLQELRRMMGRYGLGDRAVYITEMGYTTPAVDERDMAAYLVRAYAYAWSEGVRVMIWHMLQALSEGGDPGYALKLKNGTPRPAYVAYAVMTRVLERAELLGPAPDLAASQRGFAFEKRGTRLFVLWDKAKARGETSSYTLTAASGRVRVVDLMGEERLLPYSTDGRYLVSLGRDPLYVIVEPAVGEKKGDAE